MVQYIIQARASQSSSLLFAKASQLWTNSASDSTFVSLLEGVVEFQSSGPFRSCHCAQGGKRQVLPANQRRELAYGMNVHKHCADTTAVEWGRFQLRNVLSATFLWATLRLDSQLSDLKIRDSKVSLLHNFIWYPIFVLYIRLYIYIHMGYSITQIINLKTYE